MTITIRPAGRLDTRDMAALLNDITRIGGTAAVTDPVTAQYLANWMDTAPDCSAWHVAEDARGHILGFQCIAPHRRLPPDCCDIASYVLPGKSGIGIGSALFTATQAAARKLGYRAIVAVIRADNAGGLTYYQSRGFEDWKPWEDAPISPRIMKRFAL